MQLANPGHVLCMLTFFPSSANGMVKQGNRGAQRVQRVHQATLICFRKGLRGQREIG